MGDLFERAAQLLLGRGDADLDEEMETEERRQREAGRPKPSPLRVKSQGYFVIPPTEVERLRQESSVA
jgi:hypothetical protein